ncbi:invasion associated locus B family protein [Gemmobacter straminiformis]|uniref:Invasion associated locus B family protein n=1 Tax=Paragemmobacter straminiformis TaxID=2045119 RepID=A0A842I7S0_9RHOB|nr:invasion associated locus B family protein [Gemmobacter straminiformis]MBC2835443.1 invasion associated locus B family protein [Gemmobacter straminiformis]
MMSSILSRILSAAAFVALTSSAISAQEATPAPEAPAADAATTDNLSMGQQPADGVGSTYTKEKFELWEQRCVKTADGNDPCQLYQLLKDAQGTSVAEINMFSLPEGGQAAAGATVIVPLETLLTAGLRFAIDTAEPKVYPFTFCAQIGCVARIGFTADELASFKKGAKGVLTIVPAVAPKETVVLDVSLKGFTAGFDAVKASNEALPKP